MSYGRTALLVSPTTKLSKSLAKSIRNAGYQLTIVKTFADAKVVLNHHPDVLITELKLADYNGLHLAVRGQTMGIPSIVVAEKDFEHEVEQLGAVWMPPDSVEGDDVQMTLTRVIQGFDATATYPWYGGGANDSSASESGTAILRSLNSRGLSH